MSASYGRDFFLSHTFVTLTREVRWQAEIPEWLSVQRQLLLILTREVRWQAEIPKWLSIQRQLLLILTYDVRWKAEIPQVVIRTNTLLLILTRGVRWQTEIPQVVIHTHTVLLPRLVRSQVARGNALYGNPHTFRRQKCLQSLHAFKGDNDPHLHFEDDNVFSHCMSSKATMSSSTCRRRQCLQSLHAFKRRQCLHFHFEDDNVFTSKTSISFFPVLCRTQRPLFVRFFLKKKKGE